MLDINSIDKVNRTSNSMLVALNEGNMDRVISLIHDIESGVLKYLKYLVSKYGCKDKSPVINIPLDEIYNLLLRSRPITLFRREALKNLKTIKSIQYLNNCTKLVKYLNGYDSWNKSLDSFSNRIGATIYNHKFYFNNVELKFTSASTDISVDVHGDGCIFINIINNNLNTNDLDKSVLKNLLSHELAHIDASDISLKIMRRMSKSSTDDSHKDKYMQRLEGNVDEYAFRGLDNRDVKNTYKYLDTLYKSALGKGLDKVEPGRTIGYRRARFRSGFMGRDSDGLDISKGLHPIKRIKSGIKAYRVAVDNTRNFSQQVYDPPLPFNKLPMSLRRDEVHAWRAKTGIELIHKEPTYEEFKRICRNWELMPDRLKIISDKKSIELFGKDNKSRMKILESEYN